MAHAKPKTPPPNKWVKAPFGWWLQTTHRRCLAHIWRSGDKQWRGMLLPPPGSVSDPVPIGPWPDEDAAMRDVLARFEPTA